MKNPLLPFLSLPLMTLTGLGVFFSAAPLHATDAQNPTSNNRRIVAVPAPGEVTLDETFIGQESFGGFIWRDEQGRVLVQLGGPAFRIMEILGLDSTRKQTEALQVSEEQILEGMRIAAENQEDAYREPETLMIAKVDKLPRTPPSPATAIDRDLIPTVPTARIQEEGDPSRWFRIAMAHDGKKLAIVYQVNDSNPWVNGKGRFSHAFIGGDAVDLKLEVPGRGPIRVLAAPPGHRRYSHLLAKRCRNAGQPDHLRRQQQSRQRPRFRCRHPARIRVDPSRQSGRQVHGPPHHSPGRSGT